MARLVSLSVLIAAIAGLGIMFFQVVAPFLLPLFLAAVAAVILHPSFTDIRRRLKGRTRVAAGVTTTLVMLLVMVPLTGAVFVAAAQAYSFSLKVSPTEVRSFRVKTVSSAAQWAAENENWLPSGIRLPSRDEIEGLLEPVDETLATLGEKRAQLDLRAVEIESALQESIGSNPETLAASDDLASEALPLTEAGPITAVETPRSAELLVLQTEQAKLDRAIKAKRDERALLGKLASDDLSARVAEYKRRIEAWLVGVRASLDGQLFGMASRTVGGTLGIVGQTLGVFVGAVVTFFIFIVSLYYFLADGPALIDGTYRLIPVKQDYQRELVQEFGKVVRSVVLATFLAATAQGVATTAALGLCGFDHLILLLIISIVASLIPLAGTWLVWVPCVLILIAKGHWVSATLLTMWGGGVVGTMDNVIRAYVLNNDTKLHPLLALIAVLGGLQVMGIWGVFIGPIVASCLHALVKIFNQELHELSHEKFGPWPVGKKPDSPTADVIASAADDVESGASVASRSSSETKQPNAETPAARPNGEQVLQAGDAGSPSETNEAAEA